MKFIFVIIVTLFTIICANKNIKRNLGATPALPTNPITYYSNLQRDIFILQAFCIEVDCLANNKFGLTINNDAWNFDMNADKSLYSNNPCTGNQWVGITCKDYVTGGVTYARISQIDLEDMKLNGPLTNYLGSMEKLTKLNLAYNNFTGIVPDAWSTLPDYGRIQTITLTGNPNLGGRIDTKLCDFINTPSFVFIAVAGTAINCYESCWDNYIIPSGGFGKGLIVDSDVSYCTLPPTGQPTSNPTRLTVTPTSMPTGLLNNDMYGLEALCNSMNCTNNIHFQHLYPNNQTFNLAWNFTKYNNTGNYIHNPCLGPADEFGVNATWMGIECKEIINPLNIKETRITRLSLSNKNMFGKLPEALVHLYYLEEAFLNDNSIIGTLPTEYDNFRLLKRMDISTNGMNGSLEACGLTTHQHFESMDIKNSGLNCYAPCWKKEVYSGELITGQFSDFECQPTLMPTPPPTSSPTKSEKPSSRPTVIPTIPPSSLPSHLPSGQPTAFPSAAPSSPPSSVPSCQPTAYPTALPTEKSKSPTFSPTVRPGQPTMIPTEAPTFPEPTFHPTLYPTTGPTFSPTWSPTSEPSPEPTPPPSFYPTVHPTPGPTSVPSAEPTPPPSFSPAPSLNPTANPTKPTPQPTEQDVILIRSNDNAESSGTPAGAIVGAIFGVFFLAGGMYYFRKDIEKLLDGDQGPSKKDTLDFDVDAVGGGAGGAGVAVTNKLHSNKMHKPRTGDPAHASKSAAAATFNANTNDTIPDAEKKAGFASNAIKSIRGSIHSLKGGTGTGTAAADGNKFGGVNAATAAGLSAANTPPPVPSTAAPTSTNSSADDHFDVL